jgi:Uma2 family endonuclease
MSALANPVFVSVEEYLRTSYDPDCEYVDGVIEERNLGEYAHSIVQAYFTALFWNHRKDWGVRVHPEYRVQAAKTRFRVPDVTVVRSDVPPQDILRTPPLIAIEILSPEDTMKRLMEKIADYLRFSVEHIWVIDPYDRRAFHADGRGLHEPAEGSATATLTIPGTPIAVPLPELWRELDPA